MKRLLWNAILSALLGCLAWWIAHSISPCVILQRSEEYVCHQAAYSANGRYLAGLVYDKKHSGDFGLGYLQLWNLHSGKRLGQVPEASTENPVHLAWGCANDGTLLSVRRRHVEQNDAGTTRHSFVYTFFRKARSEFREHEVCYWTLHGTEMKPPNHQFAFSRDGLILAHGIHEKGKVWIESIDTSTGKVLSTLPIENAYFLASIREFPRRSGFVAITHPPSSQPPGFDVGKSSLLVLDGTLKQIELRREYNDNRFEYSFFSNDGDHLYLNLNEWTNSPLLNLKTGELMTLPDTLIKSIKPDVDTPRVFLWSHTFGKCLMMLSNPHFFPDKAFVIDWATLTFRQLRVSDDSMTGYPFGWLPASSSVLICRYSTTPPNQIVAWYHQLQKYMKWGNPPDSYCDLAIVDTDTMQTTRWHSLDGHWSTIQVYPTHDGTQLVLVLSDQSRGMQVELWDNPVLPRLIPRGILAGASVAVISFILLRMLSRRRAPLHTGKP